MNRLLLILAAGILALSACQTVEPAKPLPAARPSGLFNKKFLSLPLPEAIALAEKNDLLWRVAEIDGESQILTKDYRPNRVNFSTRNGFVIEVNRG